VYENLKDHGIKARGCLATTLIDPTVEVDHRTALQMQCDTMAGRHAGPAHQPRYARSTCALL
jgi:hypothetical protein